MIWEDKMIRVAAVVSILLVGSMLPAFADRITIKCEVPGLHIDYYTFDTTALTVAVYYTYDTDSNAVNGTYDVRMTPAEITWQHKNARSGDLMSFRYDRDTAKMFIFFGPEGYRSRNKIWAGDCVRAPTGPV
jgi:hypothetical protein